MRIFLTKTWYSNLLFAGALMLICLIAIAYPADAYIMIGELPIEVKHVEETPWPGLKLELYKESLSNSYMLKIRAVPYIIKVDWKDLSAKKNKEKKSKPGSLNFVMDGGRPGKIELATEDNIAYFIPSNSTLRYMKTSFTGKMTAYYKEHDDGIYGELYNDPNKLKATTADYLIGVADVKGVYSAYKVADAAYDWIFGKAKPYWGLTTKEDGTQIPIGDLAKDDPAYKSKAINSTSNGVFLDDYVWDFEQIQWETLNGKTYVYEINYLFSMGRTVAKPHHLYVRVVLPYSVIEVLGRTDEEGIQLLTKQQEYPRYMEVEWKVFLDTDYKMAPLD